MANCDSGKGIKVLNKDECTLVLNSLEGGERIAVMLGLYAGLRSDEVFRLKWNNVDFDEGALTVCSGKTNRTRMIPLVEMLRTELRSYKSSCNGKRLFGGQTAKHYRKFLLEINKKLKCLLSDGVSFRALRNTFGANLLEAGVPFDMVSQLLRYKSLNALLTNPSFEKYLKSQCI